MSRSTNVVNVDNLIARFTEMAQNGRLLVGKNVTQDDILVQIIGTIVKVSNEEKAAKRKSRETDVTKINKSVDAKEQELARTYFEEK